MTRRSYISVNHPVGVEDASRFYSWTAWADYDIPIASMPRGCDETFHLVIMKGRFGHFLESLQHQYKYESSSTTLLALLVIAKFSS